MRARYQIFALVGLVAMAMWIGFLVRTPTGVSLAILGNGDAMNPTEKLCFVVTNDSPRLIHINSESVEFRNAHGWLYIGPTINLSTGQVVVTTQEIAAGQSFRFFVTRPSEALPWRVSLKWFTPYKKRWWKVQWLVDGCLRQMGMTPPFSRSGILNGPELPANPPTTNAHQ